MHGVGQVVRAIRCKEVQYILVQCSAVHIIRYGGDIVHCRLHLHCNTVQKYSAVKRCAVMYSLFSAVQYSVSQCSLVQRIANSAVQFSAVLCSVVPCSAVQRSMLQCRWWMQCRKWQHFSGCSHRDNSTLPPPHLLFHLWS